MTAKLAEVLARLEHPTEGPTIDTLTGQVTLLGSDYATLLSAARRLVELKEQALRVTPHDVTEDELAHVKQLATEARVAQLSPKATTAPIVRWLMWQPGRGLAVALELLRRNERLAELESALEYLHNYPHVAAPYRPEWVLRAAFDYGWTPPSETK